MVRKEHVTCLRQDPTYSKLSVHAAAFKQDLLLLMMIRLLSYTCWCWKEQGRWRKRENEEKRNEFHLREATLKSQSADGSTDPWLNSEQGGQKRSILHRLYSVREVLCMEGGDTWGPGEIMEGRPGEEAGGVVLLGAGSLGGVSRGTAWVIFPMGLAVMEDLWDGIGTPISQPQECISPSLPRKNVLSTF